MVFYSKAMHYYMVDDHIAVLLQDGLPDEAEEWRSRRQQDYDFVAQLSIACQDAVQNKQLAADEKLVICRSFYQPGQWGIIKQSGKKVSWQTDSNPLQASADWLTGTGQ